MGGCGPERRGTPVVRTSAPVTRPTTLAGRTGLRRFLTEPCNLNLLDGTPSDPRTLVRLPKSASLTSVRGRGDASSLARGGGCGKRRCGAGWWAPPPRWTWWVLLLVPAAVSCLFGCLLLSHGGAAVERDGVNVIIDAIVRSSSRLETLRLGRDQAIPIHDFLDAVEALNPAYDALGMMFSVASNEVVRNVNKLRKNSQADREADTLHALVHREVELNKHTVPDSSYESLAWLGYGLHFTESLFQNLAETDCRLAVCAETAYAEALLRHHGPTLRMISQSVLRVIPSSRQAILEKIGVEPAQANRLMKRWAVAVRKHRLIIQRLLHST